MRFLLDQSLHLDLVVARKFVYEAQQLVSCC